MSSGAEGMGGQSRRRTRYQVVDPLACPRRCDPVEIRSVVRDPAVVDRRFSSRGSTGRAAPRQDAATMQDD
jgi:hypothetical protein